LCYAYFDQFGEAPGIHFRDEVTRFLKDRSPADADLFMTYLERLQEIDLPNQAYIISRINRFIQAREIQAGAVELARLAKEGEFDRSRELMQKLLKAGIVSEEVGLKLFENKYPTYLQETGANEKLIGFGLDPIDRRIPRGICRTDFVCLLGGYKGKKSFGCVHLGVQGLFNGKKVLHISHELSMEETEKRYDAAIGGLVLDSDVMVGKAEIEIPEPFGEPGVVEEYERAAVGDWEAVKLARRRFKRLGGKLIIRKYPMSQCTMSEIERYLDYLESFEGFVPDIVINDYPEKMRVPDGERRDKINDIYMNMKGIADERKCAMITVSQATREALRKHKMTQKDFAEDIRKLGNVDYVLAISQTDEMAEQNRMMAWVMANRTGAMDFGCKFSQNLGIGQFCMEAWPLKSKARDRSRGDEEGETKL
jgi:archaellum biogenesis ATPase FlaH